MNEGHPARPLLDARLALCDRGFATLALQRLGKRPHPRLSPRGVHSATLSLDQIRSDFEADPWANVGIACGLASGVVVVDIDVKHGDGVRSMIEWEVESDVSVPDTLRVLTPSGGLHLYLAVERPSSSPSPWLPNVDVRADNTYVVAPPSGIRASIRRQPGDHARGGAGPTFEYRWDATGPNEPAHAPEGLLAAIAAGSTIPRSGSDGYGSGRRLISDEDAMRDGLPVGSRNRTLYDLGCRWWRLYPHDEREVAGRAWAVWSATDQTGFPWTEAWGAILSARRTIDGLRAGEAWQSGVAANLNGVSCPAT